VDTFFRKIYFYLLLDQPKIPKNIFIFYLFLFSEMCPRHLGHSLGASQIALFQGVCLARNKSDTI